MEPKIIVQMWGDVICPMCPIGHVNLKKAIQIFAHKENVEIVYHSFRLRPGVAVHSVDEYLKRNHGPNTNVAEILAEVEQWAAAAGLTYKMSKTLAGDTKDAHRLIHFAKSKGLQMKAVERIQLAHFAEEQNIFDTKTLLRLAEEISLNREEVASMLKGNDFMKAVEDDQNVLGKMGVRGVPFFLIGDKIRVSGVQAPDVFLKALNQAWEDEKSKAPAMPMGGEACGTESCDF